LAFNDVPSAWYFVVAVSSMKQACEARKRTARATKSFGHNVLENLWFKEGSFSYIDQLGLA